MSWLCGLYKETAHARFITNTILDDKWIFIGYKIEIDYIIIHDLQNYGFSHSMYRSI